MPTYTSMPFPRSAKQRGTTLIVALIMLLVMTILATSGMRGTLLEERMAGNLKDQNTAFQAAEAAIRTGERFLEQAVLPSFDDTNGLLQPVIEPGRPETWRAHCWIPGGACTTTNSRAYDGTLTDVVQQPRLVIEELIGTEGDAADDSVEFGSIEESRSYRITARGFGTTPNSEVFIQSVYRR